LPSSSSQTPKTREESFFFFLFIIVNSVARWFIFKPKIPMWIHFGGPWNVKCCYISWSLGILHGHFLIYGSLVYFSPFWYVWTKKIWQPWLSIAFQLVSRHHFGGASGIAAQSVLNFSLYTYNLV
jgi:hypothetical protein